MWLPRLIDDPDRAYSYNVTAVLVPARDAVWDIIPALRKIEQMAKIPERVAALDLGKTESAIALEEHMHEA